MILLRKPNLLRIFVFALLVSVSGVLRAQPEDDSAALSLRAAARRGPAVASVLELPRESPAQQLTAVFTLLDLGEPDVAQTLWKEFATAELDEQAKASLVEELGVARFLNLARQENASGLKGARTFAESALQAAAKVGRSPQRLSKLIADLDDPSDEIRRAARSDLAVTGDAGAKACIEALAKAPSGDDDERLRTQLLLALARMRPAVEPMLIAALADGQGQFRRDIVELAGYLQLQDAVPWLAALASGADADREVMAAAYAALSKMGLTPPGPDEARAVILSEIHRRESRSTSQSLPTDDNQWWSFDAKEKLLSQSPTTDKEQQLLSSARLCRLLVELPNSTIADRRLGLIYAYQVSEVLGQPIAADQKKLAESLETDQLSETMHEAITSNRVSAAIACARLLATRADENALGSIAGRPSPLATALAHPSRELQFAALEAVVKINPTRSFAGASNVPKALWSFATSSGDPQAIVASSVVGVATDWAGQLRGRGYDPTPVTSGRQILLAALNAPQLDLLLIDSDIKRPPVREVIYGLRSNPQLAHTPIAILCSLENLTRAERIAEQDSHLLATPRPHSAEAMDTVLKEVAGLGDQPASADQRTQQAKAALGWLAKLLKDGHPYDELLRDADRISHTVFVPDLTSASIDVLTVLGTASSQQLLVDVASAPTLPIETRREAAAAFAASIKQFGKQLTSEEIVRQYDRYNASETASKETQEVLSGLIDALEK